jgi:hypothetical protein
MYYREPKVWSKESIEQSDGSGSAGGFLKTNFMLINQGLTKFYKKVGDIGYKLVDGGTTAGRLH